MATRTVTDFTAFIDESDFVPRQEIIVTGPDDILNDQQYCLEAENVLFSSAFYTKDNTGAAYLVHASFRVKGRDMCGISTTEDCFYYIKAWQSGANNFVLSLNHGGGRVTTTIAANHTDKIWRGPVTFNMNSGSNSIHTIDLESNNSTGLGTVTVGGVAIFSGT